MLQTEMLTSPQALRLHIGIFGRMNVGKSSFLNLVSGQKASIVSENAGTTSDNVRKNMEIAGLGPVSFIDTAGFDDAGPLQQERQEKMELALAETDIALLVLEPNVWTSHEEAFLVQCLTAKVPVIGIINKIDIHSPSQAWLDELRCKLRCTLSCTSNPNDEATRHDLITALRLCIQQAAPDYQQAAAPDYQQAAAPDLSETAALFSDLLPKRAAGGGAGFIGDGGAGFNGNGGAIVVFVAPIDAAAPQGRLIMPQVQSLREGLDSGCISLLVKDSEYPQALRALKRPPDLVIADSQVAAQVALATPKEVAFTSFSILFSRLKGDIQILAKGALTIKNLQDGDRVLIAEACTHHAQEDDIGRIKIPQGLARYTGKELDIVHCSGKDFPSDLESYRLIIHCGACTLNRRLMLHRIQRALTANLAITNYGMALSLFQGVLERCLLPFGIDTEVEA